MRVSLDERSHFLQNVQHTLSDYSYQVVLQLPALLSCDGSRGAETRKGGGDVSPPII